MMNLNDRKEGKYEENEKEEEGCSDVDDSQYKDEPINRDPDTSMEISEELQAKLDEIRKQFKF